MSKNINTRNKITETLLLTSNEVGLEMVIDKTKYVLMCCEQNAEQKHNLQVTSKFFENVGKFRCL